MNEARAESQAIDRMAAVNVAGLPSREIRVVRMEDDAPRVPHEGARVQLAKDVVTVLFADIEGFTRLSEALPLERTAAVLSQYYDALLSVAEATNGTVDRFIGDGAMIYWARARHGAAHADLALESVDLLREAVRGQAVKNGDRIASGLPLRVGVHTGEVLMGQIGEGAMALTLVGDVVNVAFRLQQAAKRLSPRADDAGLRGYVSRETMRHLTGERPGGMYETLVLPGRRRAAMAQRL